jgi:hypothetical protein
MFNAPTYFEALVKNEQYILVVVNRPMVLIERAFM